MKKLVSLFILFLPILLFSQGLNIPSVVLKTVDEKMIKASEVIPDGQSAIIYFFNDHSSESVESLEYLQALAESHDYADGVRILAIYNPSNGSYRNLNAFLSGNSISLETYIDVNGEFQRSMGLPANSTFLLSDLHQENPERFSGSLSCSGKLTSLVSNLAVAERYNAFDGTGVWARNSAAK